MFLVSINFHFVKINVVYSHVKYDQVVGMIIDFKDGYSKRLEEYEKLYKFNLTREVTTLLKIIHGNNCLKTCKQVFHVRFAVMRWPASILGGPKSPTLGPRV